MIILANDGMSPEGITLLENAGHTVITDRIPQNELAEYINTNNVECIVVRSATTVRKDLIDACPNLRMIGRGGVGMDNIDVRYATEKNVMVFNTPAASSDSVAELVFAHLSSMIRFLHDSNRQMASGTREFEELKKLYSQGSELRGKTIGIIGFGRIGKAVAKMAYGLGMHVMAHDPWVLEGNFEIAFSDGQTLNSKAKMVSLENLLENSDVISVHIAGRDEIIGREELSIIKAGAYVINAARGGVINEEALLEAIDFGIVAGAALDVFVGEPNPMTTLLNNPKISVSPHIGAAMLEAQARIGEELANAIIELA